MDRDDSFCIYHQNQFNPLLAPPTFENYSVKKLSFPALWTQIRFAWQLFRDNPDVLWMPVHNVPIIRRKRLKVVVTIHDLAFKIFPEYFPRNDLSKLNRLSDHAVKNADHLIAVSQCTKDDILKFYPNVSADKISVIHHGYDSELFSCVAKTENEDEILANYKLKTEGYLLYVGAIQPRKNLSVLISAFEKAKKEAPELKLILAGAPAWQADVTLDRIAASSVKDDIVITGTIPFDILPALYRNAAAFIFPSLYEGFGIPVLEAMASGAPTILANNSSLLEAGGDSALYFETENADDLYEKIKSILNHKGLREELIEKGKAHCSNFSWEKCAAETLERIVKW